MDHRRNLQSSVNEKLSAAVEILASHPEEVRIRLRFAAEHLIAAFRAAGALPNDLRLRLEQIQTDLIRSRNPELGTTPDDPDDISALIHSFRNIQKKTAGAIAERVLQLQRELQDRLGAAAGKSLTDPTRATATDRRLSGDAHTPERSTSAPIRANRSRPVRRKAQR